MSAQPKRQNVQMNGQQVRIGIAGVGYWGPKIARNFHDSQNAILTTVADLNPERLAEIQKLYPEVRTTRKFEEMLSEVDAVVVATPVRTHFDLGMRALQAGKHVLIEKPIALHAAHACQLMETAEKNNLVLMVGHTFEYNSAVEAVREIVHSDELGRIYYINSTRANLGLFQSDINVMWDLAPHDLSILCYILNDNPLFINANGSVFVNTSRNLHEVVYMNLQFGNGVLVNSRLSWLDPVKQRRLTVVGSKKMLVYDDIAEDKVIVFDKGVDVPPHSVTEEEFRASYRHGEETIYPVQWKEPLRVECDHFLDCIVQHKIPRSDGRDGLKILNILEMAQRSLDNGGVNLKIEYD